MMPPDDLAAVYLAAIRASEAIRADVMTAAEQAHADVIAQAYADHAARDRVYALAGDGRQGVYDRAAQDHFDRVAAAQRHFGQAIRARGNPDATHAQNWLRGLDVEAFRADPEPPPIGRPILAEHHPGMPVPRRIDERGIIVAETFVPGDGGRGTFSGDAATAKRFATMTQRERAEAEAYRATVTATETPAPPRWHAAAKSISWPGEAAPEPPPGLLADIAKALGKSS